MTTTPQTATVSDEAVQAAVDGIQKVSLTGELISDEELAIAALNGAFPHILSQIVTNPVDGSMTPEEFRLEDLKQMASYTGSIISFETRDPYYLASCNCCGWVGSSELCGTDSFGDDSDVYCPRCHSSGADCGKVAELVTAKSVDVAAVREPDIVAAAKAAQKAISAIFMAGGLDVHSWWDDLLAAQRCLAKSIRALSPADPVDQWQDIATAPKDTLVVVYTPPQPHDYPDAFHVDFDYIDTGIANDYWYNHGEAHEHFSCVCKPSGSIGGIPENAPYTHWMPLPAAPTGKEGE